MTTPGTFNSRNQPVPPYKRNDPTARNDSISNNAIGIAASENYDSGRQAAVIAQAVNQLVSLNYSREDELESDRLGFQFMTDANYNPEGLVELMQIFESAESRGQPPEFLSTQPNPGNRVARLQELIQAAYPSGVPEPLVEGEQEFSQTVAPRLP